MIKHSGNFVFSFRMLKMPEKIPDVLLSGDSPMTPMTPEEDNSDPVFNQEETLGQDWVKVSTKTLVTQQLGDAMEDIVPEELQTTGGVGEGYVENTTTLPMEVVMGENGDPFRENTLKDTLKGISSSGLWYGEKAENTAISPITLNEVGKSRGETEYWLPFYYAKQCG